jgi:hypothetical protein
MPDDNGITLADAKTQLAIWMTADAAVASGQSYRLNTGGNDRQITRVNASEITAKINYWQNLVTRLSGTGIVCRGVSFL